MGGAFFRTVRDHFRDFNLWLDELPDGRDQEAIIYPRRFLAWWGICGFVLQLGSRRQLDFALEAQNTHVVANLNRLAGTHMTTRPVHDTLDYFLGKSRAAALANLRTRMVRTLIRRKGLDAARLLGYFVVVVDGTGWLSFSAPHCPFCLVRRHAHYTLYHHQALEAKLLGPDAMPLSVGTAFIENADAPAKASALTDEAWKQDCELNAFTRLAPELKKDFQQLRLCLAGDSLFACGRILQLATANHWGYVLTFKEGHLPAVWQEFQSLLELCPQNRLEVTTGEGPKVRQIYRWVQGLSYQDSDKRSWTFDAILCQETVAGKTTTFAWITHFSVDQHNVVAIANQGGRARWHIENQGFNRQKNSGFNLEHMYSKDPDKAKAYYYLLQIAHILMLLLEKGALLRRLAAEFGKTPVELFGSLKNIAIRLLESVRYFWWPEVEGETAPAPEPDLEDSS